MFFFIRMLYIVIIKFCLIFKGIVKFYKHFNVKFATKYCVNQLVHAFNCAHS